VRKLVYIPIIHTTGDMGSLASRLEEKGKAISGEAVWEEHKHTVTGYWEAIARYFASFDVTGYQVYQDGLVADGEIGQRIVEEAAAKGSTNYRLLKNLAARGARIMKTEDPAIVLKEFENIKKIATAKTLPGKSWAVLKYEMAKKKLLEERDRTIAQAINDTLKDSGILFIGAYHHVIPKLAGDIIVEEVKSRDKVAEYQNSFFLRQRRPRAEELARYLVADIEPVAVRQPQ